MRGFIAKIAAGGCLSTLFTIAAAAADSSSKFMETVVVQGQKLNVETKIDRKICSVPEDAQSTLGTLSDILNVIPSVDVDPDGIVSLRGGTNVQARRAAPLGQAPAPRARQRH